MSGARVDARFIFARSLTAVTILGLVVSSPLILSPAALAQQSRPAVRLSLQGQPVSYQDDDRLGIRVRVHNDSGQPLDGFDLQVTAYDKVSSRSALHASFDGTTVGVFASFPQSFDRRLAPGGSTTVKLNGRVSDLAPLNQTTDGGVFPMTISLLDGSGVTIDSLTTELIYYPSPPETKLSLVLVVPLNALPAKGPGGEFHFTPPTSEGLDESLVEGLEPSGWLAGTVAELDDLAGARLEVGLAPTPRLIDEIADLRDGFRVDDGSGVVKEVQEGPVTRNAGAFLDSLRAVLHRPGVQPLLVPYSFPDLPALAVNAPADISTQLTQAEEVLRSTLGVDLGRAWVLPPAGRVDSNTLQALHNAGALNIFFSPNSLVEEADPLVAGCPEPALSLACPVAVKSPLGGTTQGYAADVDLQERLAALAGPGAGRLELQNFFAETAVTREELPGRGDRIINATLPSLWQPSGRMTKVLYRGVATAPWLKTVTPAAGLEQRIEVAERQATDTLPPTSNELSPQEYDLIGEASGIVQSFSQMEPPPSLVQRLQRNILVAQSRSWWSDPAVADLGPTFASEAAADAEAEMNKVEVAINKVVLTSSKGKVLLSVENSAGYPVRIKIGLESLKLAPDPPLIEAVFPPGLTREFVDVTAQATGIFSLEVSVTTPDDGYRIQQLSRPVRSTEFNRIALGITVGALLFLIGFYIQRWYRRRHNSSSSASVGPA
jgi:Family of unknown function (DUF6049)